jgi:hypothetical protein
MIQVDLAVLNRTHCEVVRVQGHYVALLVKADVFKLI